MAIYCIGDIQGCYDAFEQLLHTVDFSASRDTLYVLGDLVNRGPKSAQVLRACMAAGDSMRVLLGNHDLHLLAAAHGLRRQSKRDTLSQVLEAPDKDGLLDWLRQQPLARLHVSARGEPLLMVHAGVLPQWTLQDSLDLSAEVQAVLQSSELAAFLHSMYGNQPDRWDPALTGNDRLRCVVPPVVRNRALVVIVCSRSASTALSDAIESNAATQVNACLADGPNGRAMDRLLTRASIGASCAMRQSTARPRRSR